MKSRIFSFFTFLIIVYPISAMEEPVSVFGKSRYDTRRVFQLVADGEERIASLEGKDVVVVLGIKGAGKSTTINYLIGDDVYEREDGKLDRRNEEGTAAIGHEGYCTVIPALYSSPTSPYAFLDTRGFDASDRSPEELIAASILTEMAVKKASSVRLMVVSDYSNLIVNRAESFTGLGRVLGKIVVGNEVPSLFVFNRYVIPSATLSRKFFAKSPEEQHQEIMGALHREIDAVLEIEHNGLMQVGKAVAERVGKVWHGVTSFFSVGSSESAIDEEIRRDARFQEELSRIKYTGFLRYNRNIKKMENGNLIAYKVGKEGSPLIYPSRDYAEVGFEHIDPRSGERLRFYSKHIEYVDPLSGETSRNAIFGALAEMESVNASTLVFTGYNTERVEFNRIFALQIEPLVYLLEAKLRKDRFSLELLRALRDEAEACANHHANVHGKLANALSEDELNFIRESYAISDQEIESRRNRIEAHTKQLLLRKTGAQEEIAEILRRDPVLYWIDRWKQEAGFFAGWWRNYRSTYPHNTDFVRWNDVLEEGTLRDGVESSNTPHLIVNYTSRLGENCEGRLSVYVRAEDEPGNANEIRRLEAEISTIDTAIRENESLITGLRIGSRTNLRDKVAGKRDFFTSQRDQIGRALDLNGRIEGLYSLYENEIALSARIGEKLNTGMKAAKDLKRYHDQLPIQPTNLRDDQTDEMFGVPLLDPTLLRCKPTSAHGSHDKTYERRSISQYMNDRGNGTCPVCRQIPESLIPLPSQLTEVVDSIAADVVWLTEKLQAFEQARSRL